MKRRDTWEIVKSNAYGALNPIINLLVKTGITPNGITIIGFLITISAEVLRQKK